MKIEELRAGYANSLWQHGLDRDPRSIEIWTEKYGEKLLAIAEEAVKMRENSWNQMVDSDTERRLYRNVGMLFE